MIIVNQSIRMTKVFSSNKYMLFCSRNKSVFKEIGMSFAKLLRKVNEGAYADKNMLIRDYPKKLIEELIRSEILIDSAEFVENKNILGKLKYKYPLSSVVIELTNSCNLNCVHCYGHFGMPKTTFTWKIAEIEDLKKELDLLHTMEVRLSGGECLLNPDFERIALFFLKNGFRVGIYTNGFMYEKLKSFLEKTRKYNFYVAVSLDGIGMMHNRMRGKECYEKVILSLNELKGYDNVEVLIETAASKVNIGNLEEVVDFVEKEYPTFEHKSFVISPTGDRDISFSCKEFKEITNRHRPLLADYTIRRQRRTLLPRKEHRCMGGVINGVITADKKVKCCPIAQNDVFTMGNLLNRTLSSIWANPENGTEAFRNEYIRSSKKCRKCKLKNRCGDKNCRVEAMTLTGDWRNDNPYTCIALENTIYGETNEKLR